MICLLNISTLFTSVFFLRKVKLMAKSENPFCIYDVILYLNLIPHFQAFDSHSTQFFPGFYAFLVIRFTHF